MPKFLTSPNRNFDALDKAIKLIEDCCLSAKVEPCLAITNPDWIPNIAKVMFELMRKALEIFGLTGELDLAKLHSLFANLDYLYEGLDKKKTNNIRFTFEIFDENPEESAVKVISVEDFFNDEEDDSHVVAISLEFKTSMGIKQIPTKTMEWDGKAATAEEIVKQRPNKDTYLIRVPNGRDIGKQVLSEAMFDANKETCYGSQPKEIHANNSDPHFFLCPNLRTIGSRLILD